MRPFGGGDTLNGDEIGRWMAVYIGRWMCR